MRIRKGESEASLQEFCVREFALRFPEIEQCFFAVPNGGSRNSLEAINLKRQGVKAGVSDIVCLVPNKEFHGLCIEMKFGKNKQSERQKDFQKLVTRLGYKYVLCYSITDFDRIIEEYFATVDKELIKDSFINFLK